MESDSSRRPADELIVLPALVKLLVPSSRAIFEDLVGVTALHTRAVRRSKLPSVRNLQYYSGVGVQVARKRNQEEFRSKSDLSLN
ncbi:hypothetical protein ACROYT_G027383 [Oculina patagonica]